jgi:carbamoyltransferase
MEFGPRALGNRSILGDARNPEMQKKMNLKIKYRENFRPFAPAILEDDIAEFCEYKAVSPYLLLVMPVNSKHRNELPENYNNTDLSSRLYFKRSDVPAITHIDFSARVQTVNKTSNDRFYRLLTEFKKLTGYGILINTSFNVRGEPIVCSPENAIRCFMNTEIDYLAMNNYLFAKDELAHLKDQFSKGFKVGTD